MVDSQNINFLLKVTGQSLYSITIILCIICSVATNCIIQDPVYNVHVAALYVPPFCPTLGWYDWVNEDLGMPIKFV